MEAEGGLVPRTPEKTKRPVERRMIADIWSDEEVMANAVSNNTEDSVESVGVDDHGFLA